MVTQEAWWGGCLFPFWGVTARVILERVCQPLSWGSFLALPPGRSECVEGQLSTACLLSLH